MTKKSFGKRGAGILLIGILTFSAPAAYSQVKNRVALLRAKELLASKKYSSARETLQSILKKDKDSPLAQEAWLLQARALHLQGKHVDALESLDSFLKQFKKSPYKKRARHLLAESYHSIKKYALAASITKEELQEVASPAYRLKLARLYLDLGDEAYDGKEVPSSTPGKTFTQRDYRRANEFYAKALAIQVPPDLETPARMRQAECQRALGHHSEAVRTLSLIIKRFPDSPHIHKVRFEKGEALFSLSRFEAARAEFRLLEKDSPKFAARAIERLGDSYRPASGGNKESRLIGVSHWKRLLKNHKDYDKVERIHWKLAKAYESMGRYDECESSYRAFISVSKDDDKKGQARFNIAQSYERRGNYEQARQAFGTFLGRHPSHKLFASAQLRIATSWISEGRAWAEKESGLPKAIKLWRQFLKRYPVHNQAPKVLYEIATANYRYKNWDEAIKVFGEVVRKYPRQHGADALYYTALIYEREKDELANAIETYEKLVQKFPYSYQSRNARDVLRVMRRQSLRVETPRSFHSKETPFIRIVSRNAPKIQFKAYRLDLKEYFEKKRSVRNVAQLAVGLVKASHEWTLKTPKYEDYRLNEQRHDLPLRGKGAWVLTAETDKYVATSMILVTDIVTVIKRSPNQILVFAKDRVSGKPAKDVDILLALDGRMVKGGKTNSDGIFQRELDGYKAKVFATQNQSYSYAEANKQNSQSFGYSAKGYIYTDRPVYRPGHVVHFKGILREVEKGQYIRPKKAKVRIRIIDSQGLVLQEVNTKTNEFGSTRGSLTLGQEVSLGEYKIEMTNNSRSYTGCFFVEEYKKPEVLVNVSTEKSSYLGGEVVRGRIKTSYYYGGVVPNCQVTYQVTRIPNPFDASVHKSNAWFYKPKNRSGGGENVAYKTATADENGELKFSFKTLTGSSDYRYAITAWVQGPDRRTVTGAGQVYCTHRGYYALVETNKKVVKPGEEFRATFKTVQASHQGLAAQGELRILRLSSIGNGRQGESVIQVLPVKTNKFGNAYLKLKLDRPGDYELRFVGKDRRGSDVEGSVRIVASGDAEDLAKQAKVRADKEVYRRGDKARILLNSPKADTYALLTFEGSRVLDYKVLHLKKRSTVLELPMKDLYAPNVFVKVAIPTEDGFYQDEDEILVFKYLKVEIEADKKSYDPEGKATFKVKTLDQSGQPVSAELSLSVVDEKVYALRSETVGGMKPFFYDQRRKNIVTTAVSSTWKYNGQTREQVKELMEEISKLRREKLIKESLDKVRSENEKLQKALEKSDGYFRALSKKKSKRRSRRYDEAKKEMPSAGDLDFNGAPAPRKGLSRGVGGGGGWGKAGKKADRGRLGGLDGVFQPAATKIRKKFADTAFWSANVVTNTDGSASVEIELPSNLTLWRATARGVTRQTLVGEATTQISVTKAVVAAAALPRFLTHKDKAVITLSGHNRTEKDLKGRLGVKLTKLSGDSATLNTVKETAAGQRRFEDLEVTVLGVGEAAVEARYETAKASDAVLRKIPVKAFGEPVQKGKSGVLTDAELWSFEVGQNRIKNSAKVTVRLFGGHQDALLSGLRYVRDFPYGCVEQTVNRFLPLVSARQALLKAGLPEDALSRNIQERCTQGALRLLALQRNDGGWGWWKNDSSSPYTTGYALLGLEVARLNRVYVNYDRLYKGRRAAQSLLRQVRQSDARALLLYALSLSNQGSDDDFNRALRARDQLSAQGLAWLYLACKQRRRSYNTAPIVEDLKSTAVAKDGQTYWTGSRRRGWTHEGSEATAWAAYALLQAEPNNILVEKVANTLLARQKNGYWRSTKETAAVIFFLASYIEKKGLTNLNGSMSVEVNGQAFAQTKLQGKYLRQRDVELTIPGKLLKTGKNTIRLVKKGTGKVHYSLALNYVAKADTLKSKGPILSFDRRYRRYVRGSSSYDVPGWSIVRSSARPSLASRPSLLETVSGQRLWVDLVVKTRESLPYVMIEDMLPAGCEIISGKESGNFQRFEARDDRAVFFVTNLSSGTHRLRYMVQAVTPGEFAVLPAQGGPMYEPEVFAHGASAVLTIHDDAKSLKKAEELTPDELYAQAKRYQSDKKDQKAIALFQKIRKDYKLQASYEEDILARLLQLAVRQKASSLTVQSYEGLKDINPRRANRLDKKTLTALVVAYNVVGEFQRSHNLGRKVLLRYFEEEAQLASVYRNLGRPLPAQNYMRDLLIRYPESNSIKEQWFTLASRYLSISQPIKKGSRITMPMYTTAYKAFKDFCALFPDSPLAAQAQLNAAEALKQLGDYKGADREASFVLERHSDSRIREKALILLLRSRYARKKWDGTFKAGEGLLKLRHKNSSGYYSKSQFIPEVHYTFAKIYHVQGKLAKAVEYYRLSRRYFNDAADAYLHFTKSGLTIEKVVSGDVGKGVSLPVQSKNMKELKARIYAVDFMRLFLTRKDLRNIHRVDLTGIPSVLNETFKLKQAKDYSWVKQSIPLKIKKKGVYLVVAKSGSFDRSSLIVISDLKIKYQEVGGRKRIYASVNGKAAQGVRVKVALRGQIIASGKTDARGIFDTGETMRSRSDLAIVAELDGHYAILRPNK